MAPFPFESAIRNLVASMGETRRITVSLSTVTVCRTAPLNKPTPEPDTAPLAGDMDKTMPMPRSPMSPTYGIAPSTGNGAGNDLEIINSHLETQIAVRLSPCPTANSGEEGFGRGWQGWGGCVALRQWAATVRWARVHCSRSRRATRVTTAAWRRDAHHCPHHCDGAATLRSLTGQKGERRPDAQADGREICQVGVSMCLHISLNLDPDLKSQEAASPLDVHGCH